MARLEFNEDQIDYGMGVVKDIEKNGIEIIRNYFTYNQDFRLNNGIAQYSIEEFQDANPDIIGIIERVPGIYLWIEEFDGSVNGVGQQVMERHDAALYYKMHIQYLEICKQTDVKAAQDRVKHIMDILKNIFLKENRFRELVHGFVHHAKTSFEPDFKVIKDKMCMVQSGKTTLIVMRNSNI